MSLRHASIEQERGVLTINTDIHMYTLKHMQVYGTSDKNADRPR